MRVLIGKSLYKMTKKQLNGLLRVAKKQIPFGIYAVEKDGLCELKKDTYSSREDLDKAVAEYEESGFKVYQNGGNRK